MPNTPELALLSRRWSLELALNGVRGLDGATMAGKQRPGGWDFDVRIDTY
jgi:hypothetical protein